MATTIDMGSTNDLIPEMRTYSNHKPELLAQHAGEYVLIKDVNIIGVFHTREEALQRGFEKFLTAPFLVHEIAEVEEPVYLYGIGSVRSKSCTLSF